MRLILLFLLSLTAHADINGICPQFTVGGTPIYKPIKDDIELCNANYAVIYRCLTKTPIAVFEHVTPSVFSGKAVRQNNFHIDKRLQPQCRSSQDDYDERFDRGHMSPAEDNTVNDNIMSDSFLFSNIVPQNTNNNRGIWRKLEMQIREWATQGKDLYVITGPVFTNTTTIGDKVWVPTYLFKVITDKKSGQTISYLMPNTELPVNDLPKYVTTIDAIEKATGFIFNLPKR
jgi:endonuclease G